MLQRVKNSPVVGMTKSSRRQESFLDGGGKNDKLAAIDCSKCIYKNSPAPVGWRPSPSRRLAAGSLCMIRRLACDAYKVRPKSGTHTWPHTLHRGRRVSTGGGVAAWTSAWPVMNTKCVLLLALLGTTPKSGTLWPGKRSCHIPDLKWDPIVSLYMTDDFYHI